MTDELGEQNKEKNDQPHHFPSVDDAKPVEEGGPIARAGFNYQDEVAVSFLLDMLQDPSILRIHYETHDDILVVCDGSEQGTCVAEFIQVKAGEPDKLWSVADLCQRKSGKPGTSIYEKSLARDAYSEQSRFRILTLRPVRNELKVLTSTPGSTGREPGCERLTTLEARIENRVESVISPKGNGCAHWLENCYWDQRHDEATVRDRNRLRVFQIAANKLLAESIDVLLDDLRAWVKRAGAAKWEPDRDKKIIHRKDLCDWWASKIQELTETSGPSGGKLVRKMKAASLPDDTVNLAVDLRRSYSERLRTSRYAEADDVQDILDRVKAEANSLRARYVAGEIDLDGLGFHALCLARMNAINDERPDGSPNRSAFLQGCLYDIADRCLLRFERLA